MERSPRPLGRPRKEQDGKSTKDIILKIATGMFLEKGYPLVSMDDVAQKCDVTKATVYYYYKTKADLFTDAMVQLMIRIRQRIVDNLSTNASLETQLFQIAKAHLQATVDIDINSFMKEAKTSLTEDQLQLMKEAEDNMYGALEQAIKKAMDKGEIPQSNPRLGAFMFVSILTAGNKIDITYKDTFSSLDDLVTQIMNLFWNGLANDS
ncbi:TetR/AcrR family transcriptional regulator [Oceanobacillus chungangensis]|uniref:TetR family transcriptional regulator n=1 Tax=Oceanobacillus chungangensis TaxID=1229152 RepID=A0A3D8PHK3_9BACI|nr:TetR/AcrR family transcriptional regulator [Oceanobacillus chungangensis]RDW14967.1 TetR family transcriptional regulator [Oceanobacillus chungangensis]